MGNVRACQLSHLLLSARFSAKAHQEAQVQLVSAVARGGAKWCASLVLLATVAATCLGACQLHGFAGGLLEAHAGAVVDHTRGGRCSQRGRRNQWDRHNEWARQSPLAAGWPQPIASPEFAGFVAATMVATTSGCPPPCGLRDLSPRFRLKTLWLATATAYDEPTASYDLMAIPWPSATERPADPP